MKIGDKVSFADIELNETVKWAVVSSIYYDRLDNAVGGILVSTTKSRKDADKEAGKFRKNGDKVMVIEGGFPKTSVGEVFVD